MPVFYQVLRVIQKRLSTIGLIPVLSLLFITGCTKSTDPAASQNLTTDPAGGNLAPTDASTQPAPEAPPQPGQQPQPAQQAYPASPAPPAQTAYSQNNYSSGAQYQQEEPAAGQYASYDQQTVEAPQPPPPLPEYSQPECPGDNYIWTPGSWSYSSAGYYWVPGVWVVAPYVDALWTPPYWESYDGRYRWHRGYWGDHIGFYGGINYGFGYTGRGYAGGYWNSGRFEYNRTVNNINVSRVTNVYSYRVSNYTTVNRISYNGGAGGVQVRPTPPELAMQRERHVPPVPAQVQHMQQAATNRAQFDNVNHGHPQIVAAAAPLATPYRAPAAHPPAAEARGTIGEDRQPNQPNQQFNRPAEMRSGADMRAQNQNRNVPENRPVAPAPAPAAAQRPMPMNESHRNQPGQGFHPENRPAPMAAPVNRPVPAAAPARLAPMPMERPQPQARPQAQPENTVPNQARPEPRPAPMQAPPPREMRAPAPPPQPRTQPQARPVEAPHAPAPQARPAPPPQPHPEPARPAEEKKDHH